jgi:hypothetical protein
MPVDKMYSDALARSSTIYRLRNWERPQERLGKIRDGMFKEEIRRFYINDGNALQATMRMIGERHEFKTRSVVPLTYGRNVSIPCWGRVE